MRNETCKWVESPQWGLPGQFAYKTGCNKLTSASNYIISAYKTCPFCNKKIEIEVR